MNIIALYNIKGGVGKTASVVNLAYLSALEGKRTLLWDLDPQAASTFYFRIRPKLKGGRKALLDKKAGSHLAEQIRGTDFEGLDLLPADFSFRKLDLTLEGSTNPQKPLRRIMASLAKEYEQMFLDCAPSISVASEAIFETADVLLVPTIPTPLSLRTLEQLDQHLHRKGPKKLRVIPFLSMVDRRKQMHRDIAQQFTQGSAALHRVETPLESHIPYSSLVERMGTERAPLFTYVRGNSAPAKAYRALWQELELRLGESRSKS